MTSSTRSSIARESLRILDARMRVIQKMHHRTNSRVIELAGRYETNRDVRRPGWPTRSADLARRHSILCDARDALANDWRELNKWFMCLAR